MYIGDHDIEANHFSRMNDSNYLNCIYHLDLEETTNTKNLEPHVNFDLRFK